MTKDYLTIIREMEEQGPTKHQITETIADMVSKNDDCHSDDDPDYEYIEAWLEHAVESGVTIADVLQSIIHRDERYYTH